MDDDFDLFPKRDNLDPFSFGQKKNDPKEEEKPEEPADLVFGRKEEDAADSLPDLDVDKILTEPYSSDREPEPPMAGDRKSTRLNSSHIPLSRMPSSA